MTEFEYVSMDKARKIYVPAALEEEFRGKKYMILPMPNGDVIFHPVIKSKEPLKALRKIFKHEKRSIKEIKKEILETALGGV
ncbi:hypothetical protein J4450_07355 [Candidatus Micrarchaeota archaeon]|nr:hypothetical protein [Candidatus Micrarchaeota archaeon]